ncbi:hypothetical protein [Acidovorax sp. Root219]|uniref:hypothetical protein n=1 Tax=Acidovorax sp. Root219 TaxID=1736493 RepID=UPI000ABE138A|nr:hypothetical protein [Acidovorax sp. Root219]
MRRFGRVGLCGCVALLGMFPAAWAAPPTIQWEVLERQLEDASVRRALLRARLTADPTAADADLLGYEILALNQSVRQAERALSYAPTLPVSAEPFDPVYRGPVPESMRRIARIKPAIWAGLADDERLAISSKWRVELLHAGRYGWIADAQTVDESTPGTTGGAVLGGVLGQAAYVDRAFRPGNNYSAGMQVLAGVLGAVAGSAMDRPPTPSFRTRYHVRTEDGSMVAVDQNRSDPFRMPLSTCVELPSLSDGDPSLCSQTIEMVRSKYL